MAFLSKPCVPPFYFIQSSMQDSVKYASVASIVRCSLLVMQTPSRRTYEKADTATEDLNARGWVEKKVATPNLSLSPISG